ncbi:MAG: acyltransferase family protein [Eubacterium sp.]
MENASIINKNRIEWVDIAKGIGIILVFFGHISLPYNNPFNSTQLLNSMLVQSFHMGLFFFLSGYCFSEKEVKFSVFLNKKIKSLMIPWLSFTVIWICFILFKNAIIDNVFTVENGLKVIASFILQKRLYALWFLPCLFCLEILFYILKKVTKNNLPIIVVFTFVLLVLGVIYRKTIDKNLVWSIDVIPTALPFFVSGYVFKIKKIILKCDNIKKTNLVLLIIVLILLNQGLNAVNCCFFEPHFISMFGNGYCNYVLFYASAFCGIAATILFSMVIKDSLNILNYIGQNTLVFFGLHQIVFMCFDFVLKRTNASSIVITIIWVLIMLLTLLFFYIFNQLIIKTPLKFLIGKK